MDEVFFGEDNEILDISEVFESMTAEDFEEFFSDPSNEMSYQESKNKYSDTPF